MGSASSSLARPRPSSWGSLVPWLVCLGLTAAGFRNALAPEPGLEERARDLACTGSALAPPAAVSSPRPGKASVITPAAPPCRLQATRWEAGPLGRSFDFQEQAASRPVRVQCRREYVAAGDYVCGVVP